MEAELDAVEDEEEVGVEEEEEEEVKAGRIADVRMSCRRRARRQEEVKEVGSSVSHRKKKSRKINQ